MTVDDATKLLEIAAGSTPEQVEARFLELRTKLEDKISKAPTPGLKEKYRASLASITEAFETLTLAADSSSLPVLRRADSSPGRTVATTPPASAAPGEKDANPPSPPPTPPPYKASTGERATAILGGAVLGFFTSIIFSGLLSGSLELAGIAVEDSVFYVVLILTLVFLVLIARWSYRRSLRVYAKRHEQEQEILRDPKKKRQRDQKREITRVVAASVAFLLIGGCWFVRNQNEKQFAEDAARQQVANEAAAKQEAENAKARAAADEKAEKEQQEKLITQLRARMAELNVSYEAAMRIEQTTTRELNDLRSQERDLSREKAAATALTNLRNRIKAAQLYAQWLERYLPANPARIAKVRAEELISAKAAKEAEAAVAKYADAITTLREDIESNRADPDAAGALESQQVAADKGDVEAMRWLGRVFLFGGVLPKDEAYGLRWLQRTAEAGGDKEDAYWVGQAYLDGNGAVADPAQAIIWLRKAALDGQPAAMSALGDIFEKGIGVPADPAQSLAWRRKAAEEGGDLFQLAYFLSDGPQETQNDAEAITWYLKLAEAGNATAMYNLGLMYGKGEGTAKDEAAAATWYQKAAAKNYPAAMDSLGRAYLYGDGVPKDEATGLDWLLRAARLGDEDSQRLLRQRNLSR